MEDLAAETLALKRASSLAELVRSPHGKYFASRSFLYFHMTNQVAGFSLWGHPDSDEIRKLTLAMRSTTAKTSTHRSLVDMSALAGIDAQSFALFSRGLSQRYGGMARVITKQAVLRPSGLAGAIVAGYYDLHTPPYDADVFAEDERALDWLAIPKPEATLHALRALVREESGVRPLLTRLQGLLVQDLSADLRRAARGLGVSERTLQRQLQRANTSFQREREAAQVRIAKQLIGEGGISLTAVAFEIGCASPSHFSTLFRRVTGLSPSAWQLSAAVSSGVHTAIPSPPPPLLATASNTVAMASPLRSKSSTSSPE